MVVAERLYMYLHRVPMKLYYYRSDADALVNLINLADFFYLLIHLKKTDLTQIIP